MANRSLSIEIAFDFEKHQKIIPLVFPLGSTVCDVLEHIRSRTLFPVDSKFEFEEAVLEGRLGIFGSLISLEGVLQLDRVLKEGDRLEFYRSLKHDPKAARQNRAKVAKRQKRQARDQINRAKNVARCQILTLDTFNL